MPNVVPLCVRWSGTSRCTSFNLEIYASKLVTVTPSCHVYSPTRTRVFAGVITAEDLVSPSSVITFHKAPFSSKCHTSASDDPSNAHHASNAQDPIILRSHRRTASVDGPWGAGGDSQRRSQMQSVVVGCSFVDGYRLDAVLRTVSKFRNGRSSDKATATCLFPSAFFS